MSDSEDESKDTNLKVVLIGDGSSGKVTQYWLLYKPVLTRLLIL